MSWIHTFSLLVGVCVCVSGCGCTKHAYLVWPAPAPARSEAPVTCKVAKGEWMSCVTTTKKTKKGCWISTIFAGFPTTRGLGVGSVNLVCPFVCFGGGLPVVATPRAGGACQPENNSWWLGGLILTFWKKKNSPEKSFFFFLLSAIFRAKIRAKKWRRGAGPDGRLVAPKWHVELSEVFGPVNSFRF